MNAGDKKFAAFALIAALAGVSLIYGLTSSSERKQGARVSSAVPVAVTGPLEPLRPRPARRSDLSWGRDPFTVPRASSKGLTGLLLSGIIWDAQKPNAIINGNIVSIGDKVGQATVKQILPDRVLMSEDAKTFELYLEI